MRCFIARGLAISLLGLIATLPPNAEAGNEEGGYVGSTDSGEITCTWKFVKHFTYNQYYYSRERMWESDDNDFVDEMDIAFFRGPGWYLNIQHRYGSVTYLPTAGLYGTGYGNEDLEFLVLHSDDSVPSAADTSSWSSYWVGTYGVFNGLHSALGFRTDTYASTDSNISNYFGKRVERGDNICMTWFDAIWKKGKSSELGSVVVYPGLDGDTYYSFGSDPPASHTSLDNWYMY